MVTDELRRSMLDVGKTSCMAQAREVLAKGKEHLASQGAPSVAAPEFPVSDSVKLMNSVHGFSDGTL
jgi:hypothetical protein